ncbi:MULTISPECIES: IDEAL domain-containing protein [Bacillus]|uniref:IDEAL domain-containing protein n=1 Tax=Bacillus TaxID=1386 RepID=UPI0015814662|nr:MULTISPECIES: IDEAL domain-containing protein [Bacillus]GIN67035.1 hypothetical protein J41TS2_24560 [Bacillus sonorensis]
MKNKFKVGDQVRVKNDLIVGKLYSMQNGNIKYLFTEEMSQYLGERATIMAISNDGYILDISPRYCFVDEMLKRIVDVTASTPYTPIKEVEELHEYMLRLIKEQKINHALDTNDKESFKRLTDKSN